MKKNFIFILLLVSLTISLIGCKSTVTNSSTPTPAGSSSVSQTGNKVVIDGLEFTPQVITINAGDTVVWENEDAASHIIVFTDFTSDTLGNNDTFSHTFDTAGTYEYECGLHPTMTGKVIVN